MLEEVDAEEVVLAEATDPELAVVSVTGFDDPDLLLVEATGPVEAALVLVDAVVAVDLALVVVELSTTGGVELTAAPANLVHNPTAAALFASNTE